MSSRLSSSRCIIGSSRSRSRNWIARHSFTERANTPSGSSVCSFPSTAFDHLHRRAELFGHRVEIERQIAGFVKAIGKEARHDLFGRIGQQ